MRPFLPLLTLSTVAQALYFYIDGHAPKCFYEELPKDTLVVGHYSAEEYDDHRKAWWKHDGISIYISVDVSDSNRSFQLCSTLSLSYMSSNRPFAQETFDNDHRVVSQKGSSSGRFTFTAAESGEHKLCFTPSSNSGNTGWLSTGNQNGGIRLTLDLAIGETSALESSDKDKLEDIATRVKDLNMRLQDIRREQVFQRVCVFHSPLGFGLDTSLGPCLGVIQKRPGSSHRGRINPLRMTKSKTANRMINLVSRNVRQSSVISQSPRMLASCGGCSSSLLCSELLAHGSCHICDPSSSSKSSHRSCMLHGGWVLKILKGYYVGLWWRLAFLCRCIYHKKCKISISVDVNCYEDLYAEA